MFPGRFGLTFQRAQLTPDLPLQITDPGQVHLGGRQTAFGPFLAAAVLQDPGCFLDDGSALLRSGVEDGVDLALGHDDVLVAPHAGIGQQLLDVQQPATDTVDGVVAVPATEQGAGDGDLAEVQRQQARGVVDGEGHLGPAQRRPLGGPGKDDVVHLLGSHRGRRLRPQHPGNGVHHVGLARAVGAHHHGDAGLQLQQSLVGEGLEAPDLQCLQEHEGPHRTELASTAFDGTAVSTERNNTVGSPQKLRTPPLGLARNLTGRAYTTNPYSRTDEMVGRAMLEP